LSRERGDPAAAHEIPAAVLVPLGVPAAMRSLRELSPTSSGFAILPFVGAMLIGSLASGQLVGRFDHHRIFPICGAALAAAGLCVLAASSRLTPSAVVFAGLALTRLGIGMTTQILVLLAQAAVEQRDLGAATAGVTMFRALGDLLGLSIFGSVFAAIVPLSGAARALQVFALSAALQFGLSFILVEPAKSALRNQKERTE
jgi:MFS family permease